MIELSRISKSYLRGSESVNVLRDLDLRCEAGEFLSLMGASGAGKSTLLQILGCLDTPSTGEYRLAGRSVEALSEQELARLRNHEIGFVFQSSHFVDYLDLVDNVALPAHYSPVGLTDDSRTRARLLLSRVGLEHRETHLPAALSGGERQRVAIARSLFHSPRLLLADEPTGNLDRESADQVMQLLRQIQGADVALIVVTHDPRVANMAPRQLSLIDGALEEGVARAA